MIEPLSKNIVLLNGRGHYLWRKYGDLWIVEDRITEKKYLYSLSDNSFVDFSEKENFFTYEAVLKYFSEESTIARKGHIFKLVRYKHNGNLYIMDLAALNCFVKYFRRIPSDTAELFLNPGDGTIEGVYVEQFDTVHIKEGKFEN